MAKFSFDRLPTLVQHEIMRRVPTVHRARTLFDMPEFSCYFDNSESWFNPTDSHLFRLIKLIKPGFYFSKSFGYHWFFVSLDDEKISFTVFSPNAFFYNCTQRLPRLLNFETRPSLSFAVDFLTDFLYEYSFCDFENHRFYYFERLGHFQVNYRHRLVKWVDGVLYPLNENDETTVRYHELDWPDFFFDERFDRKWYALKARGEVVEIEIHGREGCEKCRAESMSVKNYMFDVLRKREAFHVEFQWIREERVSLRVKELYKGAAYHLNCKILQRFEDFLEHSEKLVVKSFVEERDAECVM